MVYTLQKIRILSSEEYLDKKLPTTWQGGFSITFITDSNQFHSDQDMQQLPVVLQLMSLAYFTKQTPCKTQITTLNATKKTTTSESRQTIDTPAGRIEVTGHSTDPIMAIHGAQKRRKKIALNE